ncbi:MAG: hypothetical protein JWN52_6948 [Actinomycetia bacterium]|nr:hypothetical protein [Actinomycetes bacterium]
MLREAVLPRLPVQLSGEPPLRAFTGRILDASPHLLVLRTDEGEELRLPMSASTTVWHGGRSGLFALRPGRVAIVRPGPHVQEVERVWVDIARVTGTIVSRGRDTVEVDAGPHRGPTRVVIPPRTLGQVLVRHPRLEPGFLIDVIGTQSAECLVAVRPGTSQPGYRADDIAPPKRTGPVPRLLSGTATWFGGTGRGAAYPALDPEGNAGGCPGAAGCTVLPYLSLGSDLLLRNECTGQTCSVPVTECGCVAARYWDRCVACGTSPRGRLVELTALSFVDLGGELDSGCFNLTLTTG